MLESPYARSLSRTFHCLDCSTHQLPLTLALLTLHRVPRKGDTRQSTIQEQYPESPPVPAYPSCASPIRVASHSITYSTAPLLNRATTMPDYAKMKNAELEALLKDRKLPTGGKKADMVDRLTKDDEKSTGAAPVDTKSAVNAEDEIDWDDEGDEAATTTAKPSVPVTSNAETIEKAGGLGQPPNPQAVPNQIADIDPAQTDDLTVQPPAEEAAAGSKPEEAKEPAPDYTRGLAATNLDEEIEKRKKRAEKFGMKVEDDEGLKKLERAKKFGETGPPKGLDEALPERTRKREREGGDDGGDNKRRGGGRAGGRGGRGRRDNRDGRDSRDSRDNRDNRDNRDSRDNRDNRDSRDSRDNRNRSEREPRKDGGRSNGGGNWMSEKDKAAAEARKAKWTKPAAS
jgi:SAP domain-containing ribonucleoprotein